MSCKGHLQEAEATKNHSLPTLHCECGHQILLVPDVKAMKTAINEHSKSCPRQKHYNKLGLGRLSETELTLQLIDKISSDSFQTAQLQREMR